jgi:Flp pilus assembly pilin Flp
MARTLEYLALTIIAGVMVIYGATILADKLDKSFQAAAARIEGTR